LYHGNAFSWDSNPSDVPNQFKNNFSLWRREVLLAHGVCLHLKRNVRGIVMGNLWWAKTIWEGRRKKNEKFFIEQAKAT
jgi:hypothetical protein